MKFKDALEGLNKTFRAEKNTDEWASIVGHWSDHNLAGSMAVYRGQTIGYCVIDPGKEKSKSARLILWYAPKQTEKYGLAAELLREAVKALPQNKHSVNVTVSEMNEDTIKFLVGHGFRATAIVRQWAENGRDGYQFSLKI